MKACWKKGWMDDQQPLWKDTADFQTKGRQPFFCAGGNSLAIQLPPEKDPFDSRLLGSHGCQQYRISVIKAFMRQFACKFNKIQHLWNPKTSDISERHSNGCYLLSLHPHCPVFSSVMQAQGAKFLDMMPSACLKCYYKNYLVKQNFCIISCDIRVKTIVQCVT